MANKSAAMRVPRLLQTGISPDLVGTTPPGQPKPRYYVHGTLFIMANMIICFYFVAFPLQNMYFACGYTAYSTPPSPGPWNCARYTWQWWTIWLLTLNLLLPYLMSAALLNHKVPEISRFLYWISWLFVWLNIIILAMLLVQWLLFCNSSGSYYNTACNDIRWCCVLFSASPTAASWCTNGSPCVPNPSSLQRSDEFFQAVIFSAVWSVLAWAFRRMTKDLTQKGVFAET